MKRFIDAFLSDSNRNRSPTNPQAALSEELFNFFQKVLIYSEGLLFLPLSSHSLFKEKF